VALVSIACVAGLMARTSSAGAAAQIGETFSPTSPCPAVQTYVQLTSPQDRYKAPFSGVITSWSFQAGTSPPQLKLKVFHREGTDVVIVGESATQVPVPNTVNSFDTRITVAAGDSLGLAAITSGDCMRAASGFSLGTASGDQPIGSRAVYFKSTAQLDLAASLEPDADGDGFGDETQDRCPTDASTQGPCQRTLTLDASKNKVKKGRRVGFAGHLDAPANEAACEPNQVLELQRRKKAAPDTAFATFDSVQTDAAGNFVVEERLRKTYVYRVQVAETSGCDDALSTTETVRVKKPKR